LKHSGRFLKNSLTTVLLAGAATGVRFLFNPNMGSRAPFLIYTLAVAVAAQIAGTISGVVVTAFGIILISHFAPASDIHMPTVLIIFGVVGIALSVFGGWRKQIEDDRRRIRENLETAQRIAHFGSWEISSRGRMWWSDQMYQIFGVEPGTALTIDDFYNLVHAEDREAVRQAVMSGIGANKDFELEHRIVRKSDGEIRHVHQKAKAIAKGSVHLIGSAKDTTDDRRGEMAQEILGGLLQVCAACRRIRATDTEEWSSMETYVRRHSAAKLSHGMCEDCAREWYSDEEDAERSAV